MKRAVAGFTIVEFLTSLGVFSIIIALSLSVLVTGRRSFLIANANNKVRTEVIQGITAMSQQLRSSNLNPLEGNLRVLDAGLTIGFKLPQTDSNGNLVLDSNNALIWQASGNTLYEYRFLISGTQLLRRTTDSAGNPVLGINDTVVANDITALSFSLSGTLLTINITSQKTSSLGIPLASPAQLALSTVIALRN